MFGDNVDDGRGCGFCRRTSILLFMSLAMACSGPSSLCLRSMTVSSYSGKGRPSGVRSEARG